MNWFRDAQDCHFDFLVTTPVQRFALEGKILAFGSIEEISLTGDEGAEEVGFGLQENRVLSIMAENLSPHFSAAELVV